MTRAIGYVRRSVYTPCRSIDGVGGSVYGHRRSVYDDRFCGYRARRLKWPLRRVDADGKASIGARHGACHARPSQATLGIEKHA